MSVHPPLLIVITGPVGVGKSTTSIAAGEALQRGGHTVAVIDLDQVYGFVRQRDGEDDQVAWTRARVGAAALATAWFAANVSIVIVDGESFNADELDALLGSIRHTSPDASSRCGPPAIRCCCVCRVTRRGEYRRTR